MSFVGNRSLGPCVYCGVREATTRDHVPPKGIFGRPEGAQLVTVPACARCNQGASRDDERFRTLLSFKVGPYGSGREALSAKTGRTLAHNRKLRIDLRQAVVEAEVRTESGLYLGVAKAINWNDPSAEEVIERTTRGLFYHEAGRILAPAAHVETKYFAEFPIDVMESAGGMMVREVVPGQFTYAFGIADDEPNTSIWLYEFHERHWRGAYTELPANDTHTPSPQPSPRGRGDKRESDVTPPVSAASRGA